MAVAPFDHITATYTGLHSWLYETIVAPAVYVSRAVIDTAFLDRLPHGARILDVGAGGGLITEYFAQQRPDIDIVALDLAQPQLDRARKRLRAQSYRVSFALGDATDLAFDDATFDGVVSYGSIKHWTSRQRGVAECVRVLKPGAPLLITDADRSAEFDNSRDFVANYRWSKGLTGAHLALFRTWVAGRSIDLDEGRALAAAVSDLIDVEVARIPESPLMMIAGTKRTLAVAAETTPGETDRS